MNNKLLLILSINLSFFSFGLLAMDSSSSLEGFNMELLDSANDVNSLSVIKEYCQSEGVAEKLAEVLKINISDEKFYLLDSKERTLLHLVAKHSKSCSVFRKILRKFLSLEGGIDLPDQDGNTALHLAVLFYTKRCNDKYKKRFEYNIKKLINVGANKLVQNNSHQTPYYLVKDSNKASSDIIKLLAN